MSLTVIASEAKQSIAPQKERMDCFVATAPLRKRFAFVAGNDGYEGSFAWHQRSGHLSPLAGRGRIALAIRVRGYRSINWHQLRGERPLTPPLSPQVRGEGVLHLARDDEDCFRGAAR